MVLLLAMLDYLALLALVLCRYAVKMQLYAFSCV